MRRLFAIFFLLLFLFNIGGYYLAFWGLRTQAKKDLLHRLDAENYSDSELIVLSVPLSLPYPIHQNDAYERVNGEVEYQGEYYNLVKQRLVNDTLFMICIKNHQEKKLVNAMNEYTDMTTSLPATAKHTLDLFGKLFKDFKHDFFAIPDDTGIAVHLTFFVPTTDLVSHDYPVLCPPPDLLNS